MSFKGGVFKYKIYNCNQKLIGIDVNFILFSTFIYQQLENL